MPFFDAARQFLGFAVLRNYESLRPGPTGPLHERTPPQIPARPPADQTEGAERDYMLAAPLTAAAQGWINLPEAPGMGCVLDEGRLRATRSAARA